jgi:spoIIIJ-associated protein
MTGPTLEEAKDLALEHLGVDESDAEFEVLEEPRTGLFGRRRGEARVRARVVPRVHRPKQERRDRKRRSGGRSGSSSSTERPAGGADRPARPARSEGSARPERSERPARGARPSTKGATASSPPPAAEAGPPKGTAVEESVSVEAQAEIMAPFLEGLVEVFGQTSTIETVTVDEETMELQISGDDLGLLIGPKGQTLQAVQDLARTVVQRRAPGHHEGRVRVDVGGYRQRRREALARFATQVAEDVRTSGESKALEPMGSADRKIVHDTINELEGVRTTSEGEDPSRRVRILPDD